MRSRRGSRSTFKRGSDQGDKTLFFITAMGNGAAVRDFKSSGPLIGATTFPCTVLATRSQGKKKKYENTSRYEDFRAMRNFDRLPAMGKGNSVSRWIPPNITRIVQLLGCEEVTAEPFSSVSFSLVTERLIRVVSVEILRHSRSKWTPTRCWEVERWSNLLR